MELTEITGTNYGRIRKEWHKMGIHKNINQEKFNKDKFLIDIMFF